MTDRMDEPQTDFIYCLGAITEVLKFGCCQLQSGHKVLFLIIPGEVDSYFVFIHLHHFSTISAKTGPALSANVVAPSCRGALRLCLD